MSFHKTQMGSFGDNLPCDLNGFVPEIDDNPEDFSWDHNSFTQDFDGSDGYDGYAQEQWDRFVAEAVRQTELASEALERWRSQE